jgi:UDP-N-acetylglucosamine transferase subunit ALG13
MILVTVGTNEARFDRLLEMVAGAVPGGGAHEELLVQHGPSPVRPAGAECVDFLPYDALADAIRQARVVVMHAGVGSIMTALANAKRPVVVPRLARLGEAVDDHQVALGRRLDAEGLVVCAETEDALRAAVAEPPASTSLDLGPSRRLVADLRAFVEASRR